MFSLGLPARSLLLYWLGLLHVEILIIPIILQYVLVVTKKINAKIRLFQKVGVLSHACTGYMYMYWVHVHVHVQVCDRHVHVYTTCKCFYMYIPL